MKGVVSLSRVPDTIDSPGSWQCFEALSPKTWTTIESMGSNVMYVRKADEVPWGTEHAKH